MHEEDTIPAENEKLVTRHMSLSENVPLVSYSIIKETQKRDLGHLQQAVHYETSNYMKMDYYSKRNLELAESIRGKGRQGTLLWLLDNTQTAMGGRMLKQWIDRPLIDRKKNHRATK